MERPTISLSRLWLRRLCRYSLPGILALVGVGGCKHCGHCHKPSLTDKIDNCAVVEPGSFPEPSGVFVREHQWRQTQKAELDDFVYQHEWYMDGKELGPYGSRHLDRIIRRLPFVQFPVLIDVGDDPALNKARYEFLVTAIAQAGIPAPETRVYIGKAQAEGLFGDEAPRIYYQLVSPQNGGNGGFGGYQNFGGSGNFGGASFGGGLGGYR